MTVGKYGYSCCNLTVLMVKLKGIKLKRQLFRPITVIHLCCQAIYVFIVLVNLDFTITSFCFLFRLWKEWQILHDQSLLSNSKMLLRSCSGAALCPSWSRLICFTVIDCVCMFILFVHKWKQKSEQTNKNLWQKHQQCLFLRACTCARSFVWWLLPLMGTVWVSLISDTDCKLIQCHSTPKRERERETAS